MTRTTYAPVSPYGVTWTEYDELDAALDAAQRLGGWQVTRITRTERRALVKPERATTNNRTEQRIAR